MQKWEYCIKTFDTGFIKDRLDKAGQEGWELVSVTPATDDDYMKGFFKRPLVGPATTIYKLGQTELTMQQWNLVSAECNKVGARLDTFGDFGLTFKFENTVDYKTVSTLVSQISKILNPERD